MLRTLLSCLCAMLVLNAFGAEPVRIVCIGDSITQGRKGAAGADVAKGPTFSYRYPLWKMCVDAGKSVDFVGSQKTGFEGSAVYEAYKGKEFDNEHEGYWGWQTKDVAGVLSAKSSGWKADVALILLGANDKEKDKTLEPSLAAMRELVSILRKNNPKVIVVIGHPFMEWKPFPEMGKAYAELAKSLNSADSPAFSVDLAPGWVSDPKRAGTHTVDWVHPNLSGDEKIAKTYFEAIQKFLK